MRALSVACVCVVMLATTAAHAGSCTRENPAVSGQFERLQRAQPEQVRQALDAIDGMGRKLLALRSYLRQRDIAVRWSWTQAQIDEYERSDEYRTLLDEIDRIRARFEAANPGYQLYANTAVRSLDQQIDRWNSNRGVSALADDLQSQACSEVSTADRDALRAFLLAWQPPTAAPLAAPGLSLHGRARAIDFQIHQGNQVIAGPKVARIQSDWVAQGWSDRLAAAVHGARTKFAGPLELPDEPWHYEYQVTGDE